MNIKRKIITALTLFFFLAGIVFSQETETVLRQNELQFVRYSNTGKKIRIVFVLKETPDYQVYTLHHPERLVVDIFNSAPADNFQSPPPIKDPVIESFKFFQPNFNQVSCVIMTAHSYPDSNIKVFRLKGPERIVVDVEKHFAEGWEMPLTKNVKWEIKRVWSPAGFYKLNVLFVNMLNPDVKMDVALANDNTTSREKTSSIARRKKALTAIDGGFFSYQGGPRSLVIINGKMETPPVDFRPPRTAVGMTEDKKIVIGRVKLEKGRLIPVNGDTWTDVAWAVGCGPRLIKNGIIKITAPEEALAKGGNDITMRAGRAAIGVKKDGTVILITASGYRSNHRQGLKLDELARLMKFLGAHDAMALDGGNSTTMVIKGRPVSFGPSNKTPERKVADAILVFDKEADITPENIMFLKESIPETNTLIASGTNFADLKVMITDSKGNDVPDGTIVTFYTTLGKITHKAETKAGLATARLTTIRKPGNFEVRALCGSVSDTIKLSLIPGKPSMILLRIVPPEKLTKPEEIIEEKEIEPDEPEPEAKEKKTQGSIPEVKEEKANFFFLEGLILDKYNNTVRGERVKFKSSGGRLESLDAITDENGTFRVRFYPEKGEIIIEVYNEMAGTAKVIFKVDSGEGKI